MIQNIETIKKELKNHIEIDITYPIVPGTIVKYITLNGDDAESFYLGGEFVKKGYEKIFLRKGNLTWAVKTKYRDDENYTFYNSRFFINEDKIKEKKEKQNEEKDYEKIIKSQQHVIDKLSKELVKYQKMLSTKNTQLQKQELIIKNLKK